jgi:hypothetical protein
VVDVYISCRDGEQKKKKINILSTIPFVFSFVLPLFGMQSRQYAINGGNIFHVFWIPLRGGDGWIDFSP